MPLLRLRGRRTLAVAGVDAAALIVVVATVADSTGRADAGRHRACFFLSGNIRHFSGDTPR
jgi:hypothetical protein